MQHKVKFGTKYIKNETPEWARMLFSFFFWLTSLATLYISIFTHIAPELKLQIANIATFANLAMRSFTKLFGIVVEEPSNNLP